MTSSTPQPGWYADPAGTSELRWWDGGRWTDAVVRSGLQASSPLPAAPRAAGRVPVVEQARREPAGSLLSEQVLVVSRLAGGAPGQAVHSASGRLVGSVVEVGRTGLTAALRRVPGADRLLAVRLEVRDDRGVAQLRVTRPAGRPGTGTVVERPGVGEVGQLVPQDAAGRVRLALVSGGREVGSLDADGRQAREVALLDEQGVEVARARRTSEPGTGDAASWDDCVVHVHRPLADPLRCLVLASVLALGRLLPRGAGPDGRGPR